MNWRFVRDFTQGAVAAALLILLLWLIVGTVAIGYLSLSGGGWE